MTEWEKGFDLRDAHITFICEETGETFRRRIRAVNFIEASEVRMFYPDIDFEDDELLEFELERLKKV